MYLITHQDKTLGLNKFGRVQPETAEVGREDRVPGLASFDHIARLRTVQLYIENTLSVHTEE